MKDKLEYIHIGKLVATHGLTGELILKHALGKKSDFKNLKTVFIKDKSGGFIPWFVAGARIKNDTETYIRFESIATIEQAKALTQKEVWLTWADFEKHSSKKASISLLGYAIINDNTVLGNIEEIIEQPHQILCRLHINGKEVFIPLHEETLVKTDAKNKTVHVTLPDGLLDVYLL